MRQMIVALVSGVVFAVGLAIGGMTDPARVKGFLDVFGVWDPTLVFVMAGAVGTAFVIYRLARTQPRPALAGEFTAPAAGRIDGRLTGGAALFGVGWGLSGFCPGPAIVGLAGGYASVGVYVLAMAVGMLAVDRLPWRRLLGGGAEPLTAPTDG